MKTNPKIDPIPKPFTISELKQKFSANWQYVFRARRQGYAKVVEDMLQRLTNILPFGARLHRRVGPGAKNNKGDGTPGFLAKVGITFYKMQDIIKNVKGQIESFHGVGMNGELTKAWVWH